MLVDGANNVALYGVIVGFANNDLEWTERQNLPVLFDAQTSWVVDAKRDLTGRNAVQN